MYMHPWHAKLAMEGMCVLSQVILVFSLERNWSAHLHTQTSIRNKLSHETTEKLVSLHPRRAGAGGLRPMTAAARGREGLKPRV